MSNPLASAAGLKSVRWVGTLGIVSASLGIAGILSSSIGFVGLAPLLHVVWEITPWLLLLAFAILVRLLPGERSMGAAFGQAVVAAVLVGPSLNAALSSLRQLWGGKQGARWEGLADATSSVTTPLAVVGLLSVSIAGALLIIAISVPVLQVSRLDAAEFQKSPFRIEVLTLIAIFVLMAFVLHQPNEYLPEEFPFIGTQIASWAPMLLWVVPLSLVLGLGLRAAGTISLWMVVALLSVFIGEPLVRTLGASMSELIAGENDPFAGFSVPQIMSLSTGWTGVSYSPWLSIPILSLVLVIILWNTRNASLSDSSAGPTLQAPIETWSVVAVIASFIPLLAIPAVLVGHMAYEGIVARNEVQRGRLLAATAVVVGMSTLTAALTFSIYALANSTNLLGG